MAMRGAAAQANEKPGPHLLCATVQGCLVLLAVPRGSGSFFQAAVLLTLPHAASRIKLALAVRWAQAQALS